MDITFLVLLVTFTLRSGQCTNNTTDVVTDVGTFTGMVEDVTVGVNVKVTSFLGIPYAEAPVGNLRYAKSVLKSPLHDTYNATFHRPMCTQDIPSFLPKEYDTSEDCLYLNIYVKSDSRTNTPVMIWLHGGFNRAVFKHGGSNFYSGDVLAAHEDVIVVTINYRLSMLGFPAIRDKRFPGNYGLWDQHTAIRWVHNNIDRFNGDPSRVTLFGQQTGAVCALHQGMYIGNKGLVHGIIAQSGSPITIGNEYIGPFVEQPTGLVGLNMYRCLLADNPAACTHNVTRSRLSDQPVSIPTTPVYDGDFVRADPRIMLNPANNEYKDVQDFFHSLSLLIGYNDMDGLSFMNYSGQGESFVDPAHEKVDPEQFKITHAEFEKAVNVSLAKHIFIGNRDESKPLPEGVTDRVVERYSDLNDPYDPDTIRDMLLQFTTDYVFRVPVLRTVQLYKALGGKHSYVYKFSAQPGFKFRRIPTPSWARGANNGDEIPFIFGFSRKLLDALNVTSSYVASPAEMALSRRMMSYWATFAKTGKPDADSSPEFLWPEYSSSDSLPGAFSKLSLESANHSVTVERFGEPSASFWKSLNPYFDTHKAETNEETDANAGEVICRGEHTGLRTNVLEIISLVLAPVVVLCLIVLAIACICCCRVKRDGVKYEYQTVEMSGRYKT